VSAFTDQEKNVSKVILAGMKAGLSEARSLEKAGLLLTDARRLSIASTALLDVARLLDETALGALIPAGRGYAANDVKRSIVEWIEHIVEANKEKK
jgi:hypothetical protein